MPANLTPEYFKAEQWFRSATTNEEKILALERMLAVMPKHKGTDGLKADLRRKLSKLREVGAQKSATAKHVDVFHVKRSGAGQIVLLGVPNSGKSTIVAALTNAKVNIADFPFATGVPVPGMMQYEDIQIQLVDMPPITAEHSAPGQVGTYRNCDLIVIVIDLSQDVEEQMPVLLDFLESRRLLIDEQTPALDSSGNVLGRKAFCVCTKSDIAKEGAYEKAKELCSERFNCIKVSADNAEDIKLLADALFRELGIIRIYSKPPGQKPDMKEPFTLPAGSTVMDLARAIHRDLAEKFRYARIWGTGVYDGQNCQRNHVLNDKDVIELHFG
jgi:ribosome-interacting GTPase 1